MRRRRRPILLGLIVLVAAPAVCSQVAIRPHLAKALFACGTEVGKAAKWSPDVASTRIMVAGSATQDSANEPIQKACHS